MVRLTLLEKSSYFNWKYRLIGLFYFQKSCENLSGQGVVQSEPKWYSSLPVTFRLKCKKNGPPNFPRKKVYISILNIDLLTYSIFKK